MPSRKKTSKRQPWLDLLERLRVIDYTDPAKLPNLLANPNALQLQYFILEQGTYYSPDYIKPHIKKVACLMLIDRAIYLTEQLPALRLAAKSNTKRGSTAMCVYEKNAFSTNQATCYHTAEKFVLKQPHHLDLNNPSVIATGDLAMWASIYNPERTYYNQQDGNFHWPVDSHLLLGQKLGLLVKLKARRRDDTIARSALGQVTRLLLLGDWVA